MTQQIIFYAFALLITLCSVMVIASRNPISSAIFLVGDLFLLAGLYALMEAHFIAAIQVLVYAGAIVVLFIFVIMLLNLGPNRSFSIRISPPEVGMMLLTIIGFFIIAVMMVGREPAGMIGDMTAESIEKAGGNTYVLGMLLFTKYLWPFELASILILLAIVASIVIAKKDTVQKKSAVGPTASAKGVVP
jgi:NADH-quinone oxidoreductase subunit J